MAPKKQTTKHPFRAVRNAGVPLICYETGDPWATEKAIISCLNGTADTTPIISWDCVRAARGLNEEGGKALSTIGGPDVTMTLAGFLARLNEKIEGAPVCPQNAVIFVHNPQRWIDDPLVVQGVCNLRNTLKAIGANLVMLTPGFVLPPEFRDDTIKIDEPHPTEERIGAIVGGTYSDFQKVATSAPAIDDMAKITDTLLGYRSEFNVEQSLALALDSKIGVDLDRLWNNKVDAFRQTSGLEISLPKESFADLRGAEGAKHLLGLMLHGKKRPRAILLWDEIEKMVAGSQGGDLSGTSQAMIEQFLFWVEQSKTQGLLMVGIPGAGKTRTAQCVAGESKSPLLRASMSTVKGSLVGQSEQNMRNLLRAVDAIGQGEVLMLATCNSLEALSPEVMARFKLGIMFYDYPGQDETAQIWQYYMGKYELKGRIPEVKNWVGREIESCCHRAWLFDCSLAEAAKTVVPVSVASAARMEALRQSANSRFLSAAAPGPYKFTPIGGNEFYTDTPATGRSFKTT